MLRDELKKHCSKLRKEFWRLLPQDTHLVRRTDKFFNKAPISTVKMWKCRVNVAEKLGIAKRNTIGTDLNSHLQTQPNKEEKKANRMKKMMKINPSVSRKHLIHAGATYKPRDIRSTLEKRASKKRTKKCALPSACMKHSINVSATYKPKQCIGSTTKQRNTTSNDQTNQLSKSTCIGEPFNNGNQYKSRKVNKPKQSKMVDRDAHMNGRKREQVELMSRTKRKIKKKLPPIRIVGKFEVQRKSRKRKIDDSVGIRDSTSETLNNCKKGTEILHRANEKKLVKSRTDYVIKKN